LSVFVGLNVDEQEVNRQTRLFGGLFNLKHIYLYLALNVWDGYRVPSITAILVERNKADGYWENKKKLVICTLNADFLDYLSPAYDFSRN